MKASEIKKKIDEQLKLLGKDDFEVVLKCDDWIYDIYAVNMTHEKNGVEHSDKKVNVICLRASQ